MKGIGAVRTLRDEMLPQRLAIAARPALIMGALLAAAEMLAPEWIRSSTINFILFFGATSCVYIIYTLFSYSLLRFYFLVIIIPLLIVGFDLIFRFIIHYVSREIFIITRTLYFAHVLYFDIFDKKVLTINLFGIYLFSIAFALICTVGAALEGRIVFRRRQ